VDHQRLILKQSGETLCELSDNKRMLGFYSVSSGMEIHIIDTDPFSLSRGGGLTDTSLVGTKLQSILHFAYFNQFLKYRYPSIQYPTKRMINEKEPCAITSASRGRWILTSS
jgi:hypothetical protein